MNGFQLGGKKLKVQLKRENNKHSKPYWQKQQQLWPYDTIRFSVHICQIIDRLPHCFLRQLPPNQPVSPSDSGSPLYRSLFSSHSWKIAKLCNVIHCSIVGSICTIRSLVHKTANSFNCYLFQLTKWLIRCYYSRHFLLSCAHVHCERSIHDRGSSVVSDGWTEWCNTRYRKKNAVGTLQPE